MPYIIPSDLLESSKKKSPNTASKEYHIRAKIEKRFHGVLRELLTEDRL